MITKITYGVTNNLGDYNSERIDAEYMLSEGENPNAAMVKLKAFVKTGCIELGEANDTKPSENRLPVNDNTDTDSDKSDTLADSEPKEEVKEEAPKKKAKKKATKKAPAKKVAKPNVVFDYENKEHKKAMAGVLREVSEFKGKDSAPEVLAKAKEVTQDMIGKDMYSPKGELLDTFKELVQEAMADEEDGL